MINPRSDKVALMKLTINVTICNPDPANTAYQ